MGCKRKRPQRTGVAVNANVFITIAFAGIALLVPLVFVVLVLPQARREARGARQRESARHDVAATRPGQAPTVKGEHDAAVH